MRDTSAFTCRTGALVLVLAAVGSGACAESDKTPSNEQDAGDASTKREERTTASTAADSGTRSERDTSRDAATDARRTPDASTEREPESARKDAAAARADDAAAPSREDATTPQTDAALSGEDTSTPQTDAAAPRADAAADAGLTGPRSCAPIDKIDLLLMVDDSNSMAGEQASLKNAFPGLVEALTSGSRFPGDPAPFPAVRDLHVGVVSSDMGIPGVELPPSCSADGGDDGRLQNSSSGEDCEGITPLWLSFSDSALDSPGDVTKFSNDLRCIAGLGTGGCGFEQQLESPLKALSPRRLLDASGAEVPNPFRFISTTESGTYGRGDLPIAEGGNLGFLRPANDESPSLLVVVAVTDEDDCSVKATGHLRPNNQLPEDSPLRMEDINLRCYLHKEFLYDLRDRYYTAFRALRPGLEDRVMFAAIAGVPADLVSSEALAQVDFDSSDSASRQAFYNAVLSDERMQERVDPATMPGSGQGNLATSCARFVDDESLPSSAYPPRRIVELAQMFDKNSTIQSICQDDFTGPTRAIVDMIARKVQRPCEPPP